MKIQHKMKKGDKKSFSNLGELQEFLENHSCKINEFALQCGQGKDENGYNIIKA